MDGWCADVAALVAFASAVEIDTEQIEAHRVRRSAQ
jgi:hypothetical protein